MQPKTTYTYAELQKRPTQRIIAIYNRVFNTDAGEEFFNPYTERYTMIVAIMEEMRAEEILATYPETEPQPHKPFKALIISVTPEGFSLVWTNERPVKKHHRRALSDDQVRLMKSLRQDGEPLKLLSEMFGIEPSTVSAICNGKRFAHIV